MVMARRPANDAVFLVLISCFAIVTIQDSPVFRYQGSNPVQSDPSYAELDDYNLYSYKDSSYSDTDIAGNIFNKDDVQYHNYYTWMAETRDKSRACTKHDFICPMYEGMYGYCLTKNKNNVVEHLCDDTCDCMNCADETLCDEMEKVRGVLFDGQTSDRFSCDGSFIPNQWKCDGYCDCANCGDESTMECGNNQRNYCRSKNVRCNGWRDCMDNSDEKGCPELVSISTGQIPNPNGGTSKRIKWYKCDDFNKTHQWYHREFRCDGKYDCSDKSDENFVHCKQRYDTDAQKCAQTHQGLYCKQGEHQPFICLKISNVCNHRGDEQGIQCHDIKVNQTAAKPFRLSPMKTHSTCTSNDRIRCTHDEYRCQSKGVNLCLPADKLCDGEVDCIPKNESQSWFTTSLTNTKDNTDEDPSLCSAIKNCDPCDPNANDSNCLKWKAFDVDDNGSCKDCRCTKCSPGFKPVPKMNNGNVCADIDECQINHYGQKHHPCSHGCMNTVGSYHCHCPAGLVLTSDGRTCRPINARNYPIFFYVSQKNKVTQLEVQQGTKSSWEPLAERTIFEREGVTFTALAIDENNMNDEKNTGKQALVYIGSYNRNKVEDEPGKEGASIYKWNQKTGMSERFYQFTTGKIEGMAFDFITGTLHVALTNYTYPQPCQKTKTTSSKPYRSGVHVMFPTYAAKEQNKKIPYFTTHANLTKPRAILCAPAHATTYILDWKNSNKYSYLYAIRAATWKDMGSKSHETIDFDIKKRVLPMHYANALVNDKFNHRLLIFDGKADNKDQTVISCNYNITKCSYVFKHSSRHFYGAALVGKQMFFAEMKRPEILRVDIFNPVDTTVFKRFNSQTYNLAVQNYEYQSKSSAAQNFEVCKETKRCEYLCITSTLEGLSLGQGKQYNYTNFGIMGASCMCPDGGVVNSTQSCEMEVSVDKDGNHIISEVGIVLSNKNNLPSLTIFDVGKGRTGRIQIDIDDGHASNFNQSNFYHGEFYDPIEQKLFKWRSDEGRVHTLDISDFMECTGGTTVVDIKNSRVSYGSMLGLAAPNSSYLFDSDWIGWGRWKAKMTFRKPVVVAELGIVCGYTYREEEIELSTYPKSAYILVCMKTGNGLFANRQTKAFPIVPLESPGIFHAHKYGLVYYENYELIFLDWWKLSKPWHTEDMTNFTSEYGQINRLWAYDGHYARVYITTYDELYSYQWGSSGSEIKQLLNMTAEAQPWCTGKIMSSGFSSVTAIGTRLYGGWKAYCYIPYNKNQTYSYYSSSYHRFSVQFSCDVTEFSKVSDCALVHATDRLKHSSSYRDDIAWAFFVNLNSKPSDIKQVKCPANLSKCPTFCAPNPYDSGVYCSCPYKHQWDNSTNTCKSTKVYSWTMKCEGDGKKMVYLNESKICDGIDDCSDGEDELGCNDYCPVGKFRCTSKSQKKKSKCVAWTSVCDGKDDCSPGSSNGQSEDEADSFCKKTRADCTANHEYFCSKSQASQWSFSNADTSTGYCMPWNIVADGWDDCNGGVNGYGKTNYWDESFHAKKTQM